MVPHGRFLGFLALFGGLAVLLSRLLPWPAALMAGFDLALVAFALSVWRLVRRADAGAVRREAAANDVGQGAMLFVLTLVRSATLVAVGAGVSVGPLAGHMLPVATLIIAWLFGGIVMALHDAHLYYAPAEDGHRGGLIFPRSTHPLDPDFLYFAFNLGMTYQVSDVVVSSPGLRVVVLVHCLLAFFFNIFILALAFNIVAGLVLGANP
ncbi:DUF1345 domain-containing protein [Thermaurantiacus sp.]